MINLMPIEEKKKMRNSFFARLLAVFFIMVGCLVFITSIALLPAFFVTYGKKEAIDKNLKIQKNQAMPEIDKEAQVAVEDLNKKLNLIEEAIDHKYIFSERIINEILLRKTEGIKITKIFYENDKLKGRKVIVSGIAESREQLLQFRRAFENTTFFQNINLPISNFVKGKNIQFNLELTAL